MEDPTNCSPAVHGGDEKVPTRKFKQNSFLDVKSPTAIKILSRVVVLTNNGSQPCVYSTQQIVKDFKCSTKTVFRALNELEDKGFIQRNQVATQEAVNVRSISVTALTLDRLVGKSLPAPNSANSSLVDQNAQPRQVNQAESADNTAKGNQTGLADQTDQANQVDHAHSFLGAPAKAESAESEQSATTEATACASVTSPNTAHGSTCTLPAEQQEQAYNDKALVPSKLAVAVKASGKVRAMANFTDLYDWSSSGKEGVTRFDFSAAMYKLLRSQKGSFIINGQPANLRYDFTALRERISSQREYNEPWVCYFSKEINKPDYATAIDFAWRDRLIEFMIFDELCNYQDQMFQRTFLFSNRDLLEWDKYDLEQITKRFAMCQSSILFNVLGSVLSYTFGPYTYWDDEEVLGGDLRWAAPWFIERILKTYHPTENGPANYISTCMRQEVLKILSDPKTYRKAIDSVAVELYINLKEQSGVFANIALNPRRFKFPGYYPNNRKSGNRMLYAGLNYTHFAMPFRLSYPYLLYRKGFMVQYLAHYDYMGVEADTNAIAILRELGSSDLIREQWQAFVNLYKADYPFLTKVEFENV